MSTSPGTTLGISDISDIKCQSRCQMGQAPSFGRSPSSPSRERSSVPDSRTPGRSFARVKNIQTRDILAYYERTHSERSAVDFTLTEEQTPWRASRENAPKPRRMASTKIGDTRERCNTEAESAVELRRRIGSKRFRRSSCSKRASSASSASIPRSTRLPRRVTSARARKRKPRNRRCCTASARPAARAADRHQGSRGNGGLLTTSVRRSIAISFPSETTRWSRACARRARSSSAKPTCRNSAPARTAATSCGARPEIRSTRCSTRAARRAAPRWRSRATCCRCAPAPDTGGSLRIPRRNAAWSAFGRRRARAGRTARTRLDADLGRRSDGPHRRRHVSAHGGAGGDGRLRSVVLSGRRAQHSRCRSRAISARCASHTPKTSACARSTTRSARCSATRSPRCGTLQIVRRSRSSIVRRGRPLLRRHPCRRTTSRGIATHTKRIRIRSAPTCARITRSPPG